jgi:transcriptional regulator with XRE-family HTH domain
MATEMNVCSGCQYPRREGKIFVLTPVGMLCESCVSSSYEQLALARRRVDAMAWVRRSATLLFDLAEPKQPMWHSEADLARLRALASQLSDLAIQYVLRRGPFADAPESSVTKGPGLQGIDSSTAPSSTSQEGSAPEELVDALLGNLLDDELDCGDFLDDRPHLALVRETSEQPPAAATIASTPNVEDSRAVLERFATWMRDQGLSQEALAKRSGRQKTAIAQFLRQNDRHTSLRFYLELVRSAGAVLRGIQESTPHAVIARFKELIARQDLSLSTLALRARINRSQLSTIFNKADPNPSLWTVQRLATALCVEGELDLVTLQPQRVVNGGAPRRP